MKASPPSSSSWMVEVGKLLKTFFKKYIYFFLAALGLRCCTWAFSSCGGFSYCGTQALGASVLVTEACGLSNCGSRALELRLNSCGTWA